MNHFLHKHRYWFIALIALTIGIMIWYNVTDDEAFQPANPNQPGERMPAAGN